MFTIMNVIKGVMENIGRVHSHLAHKSILGFKGLFLGITSSCSMQGRTSLLCHEELLRRLAVEIAKLRCVEDLDVRPEGVTH